MSVFINIRAFFLETLCGVTDRFNYYWGVSKGWGEDYDRSQPTSARTASAETNGANYVRHAQPVISMLCGGFVAATRRKQGAQ